MSLGVVYGLSKKNNMSNKNKVPFGIWLRIRGYLADAASLINGYLFRQYSARRQWADQASSHGQYTAIAFDNTQLLHLNLLSLMSVCFVHRSWRSRIGLLLSQFRGL